MVELTGRMAFYRMAMCMALLASPLGHAVERIHSNSIAMEFVLIPAGSFLMGSAASARDAAGDE